MKMIKIGLIIQIVFLSLISTSLHAAGFKINERGVKQVGTALAGSAVLTEDASVIAYNPAGLARLTKPQLSVAGHLIDITADFIDTGSSTTGPASTNADDSAFVPNIYAAYPINKKMNIGLGVYAPMGLSTTFNQSWQGRYHSTNAELTTINISPSFSYRTADSVSLGLNVDVQLADATLENAIDYGIICFAQQSPAICNGLGLTPGNVDGQVNMSADDVAIGYTLGVLWDIDSATRLGFVYQSQVDHTLEGTATFTSVPAAFQPTFNNTAARASLTTPDEFTLSFAHDIGSKWRILADFGYAKWKSFSALVVKFDNTLPDKVVAQRWEDVWRAAIGFNYRVYDNNILRAGFAYDQSPVPSATLRSPRVPDQDRRWFAVGYTQNMSGHLSADLSFVHILINDAPLNNTDSTGHLLKGRYESDVNIFSAQVNWKF